MAECFELFGADGAVIVGLRAFANFHGPLHGVFEYQCAVMTQDLLTEFRKEVNQNSG